MEQTAKTFDWDALEQATHFDPAGRNLATLAVGGCFWDAGHLRAAAMSLAQNARRVIIVTGFCRRSSIGMTAETDGPPGALLLARALQALEIDVLLVSDRYALPLLQAGCDHLGLGPAIAHEMPIEEHAADDALPASDRWCEAFFCGPALGATHLVAIERPGPSHTPVSLARSRGPVRRRSSDSSVWCPRPISTAATTCAASGSTHLWPRLSDC